MTKSRRPRESPSLKALVAWWHERRRGLRPDWWAAPDVSEVTAASLGRDASVVWQDHGREILRELEEERRALERAARIAYARTGQWLTDLGLILTGRKWSGKTKALSVLAKWYSFSDKPIGLAERMRQDLEGEWASGAMFFPEFSLSGDDSRTSVASAYNESLANALKRLRLIGLEPLFQAAKWLEERLPEALLRESRIGVVRKNPLDIPAAAVLDATNSLHKSVSGLVYDAVVQHAEDLSESQRDDLHEALDEALFAQIDYGLRRRPAELQEVVDREQMSIWPNVVVLPLVLSGFGSGMAHLKDPAGIQRSMAWLRGLDEAWQEWLSMVAPSSGKGREQSFYQHWCKSAVLQAGSRRDRTVHSAAATTFLLERISTAFAAVGESVGSRFANKLPLKTPRLEDCQVRVKLGEGCVVVAVPGLKGETVRVKPSIMQMLVHGLSGTIPKSKNRNDPTHFRHWFREHFQVLGDENANPIKIDDDGEAYAVLFSLSLFDHDIPIGEAQFPGRVTAALRAEAREAQRRSGTEVFESVDRSLDVTERIRSGFEQQFDRPPSEEEVANLLLEAQRLDLGSE